MSGGALYAIVAIIIILVAVVFFIGLIYRRRKQLAKGKVADKPGFESFAFTNPLYNTLPRKRSQSQKGARRESDRDGDIRKTVMLAWVPLC